MIDSETMALIFSNASCHFLGELSYGFKYLGMPGDVILDEINETYKHANLLDI